jgi:hypothetical protein
MRWPRRIYKRRRVWHWLSDAGAPHWLWGLFVDSTWHRCEVCGVRGVGRRKHAAELGGGIARTRHYCSTDHYFARHG